MPFHVLDKSARFMLPVGEHNLHSGNGKFIRHRVIPNGSSSQVYAQLATALGVQHAVVKLAYDGVDIPSSNYIFHKGTPGEVAADAYFPQDVNHWADLADNTSPAASFINYKLLPGMEKDNKPDKAVVRMKCLELEDYNATGVQTGFDYFPDAGLAVAYNAKIRFENETHFNWKDLIEWGALDEFRAWCSEDITITKDAQQIQVPRFRFDDAFPPGMSFKQCLRRIKLLTCSGYQWRVGKVRFIPGADRTPEHDFNKLNLGWDYKFQPVKNDDRPNGVVVKWRDLDTPLLEEAKPIIIVRDSLLNADGGIENFAVIDYGNAYADQVERFANYIVQVLCDFTDFAAVRGSFVAYPVLPEDLMKVTHPIPNWTAKICRVIKKSEKEDRQIKDGVEDQDTGYKMFVREEPVNPYSDVTSPVVTKTPASKPNPYAPPPEPVITVIEVIETTPDQVTNPIIRGVVNFGDYGFDQWAKIGIERPSDPGIYHEFIELRPQENNQADFRIEAPESGINNFKAVPYGNLSAPFIGAPTIKQVNILARDFVVDGFNGRTAIESSLNGLLPSGERVENDTGKVLAANINPSIIKQIVMEAGETLDVRIAVQFASGATHNNANTVDSVEIDVFDQFGTLIDDNDPIAANSNGGVFSIIHDRKYADAIEGQAYYRIRVRNKFGWSDYVYLQGTTKTTTVPAAKSQSSCPLDLVISPITDMDISIGYQFSGNVDLYVRPPKSLNWTKHNPAAITTSPTTQSSFSGAVKYEGQLRSIADGSNRSNIVQFTMPRQPSTAPTYPAPTNPGAAKDATLPKSKLNAWCTSVANVATKVFVGGAHVYTALATAAGNLITYSISSLGEDVTKTFEFQHDHGGGNLSAKTDPKSATTDVTPPSATKPNNPVIAILANGDGTAEASVDWSNNGGDGTFTIERKYGSGGNVTEVKDNHASPVDSFNETLSQLPSSVDVYYRLKDNDIGTGESAFTGWENDTMPGHNPHGGGES